MPSIPQPEPLAADAVVVRPPAVWRRSPLDCPPGRPDEHPTVLRPAPGTRGGIVVDPAEVEQIRARFEAAAAPGRLRRLVRRVLRGER